MATSLLNKLTAGGSLLSELDGATPSIPQFDQSTLHNEYSLNGNPTMAGKPSPSLLDLEGAVPTYNYRDNAPEGTSF